MRTVRRAVLVTAAAALTTGAIAAPARIKGAELGKQARISLATARMIALNARPGTITDQQLEKEKGGSGLRYSFDITSRDKPYEVGIDARTGSVLENGAEGNHPD